MGPPQLWHGQALTLPLKLSDREDEKCLLVAVMSD